MTGTPAIRAAGLGKRYRISARAKQPRTRRERLARSLLSPFDYLRTAIHEPSAAEILWAIRDVSFEVEEGEAVAVIGRNGAGKSTLLKVLSRITEPTAGRVELWGRVSSLLEVGTGFHPELTGRENVFLNGAIMGMRRSETARRFDEIVDFAGVDRFIDTPVKRYSSGMYVRLAFAVAAHLEPDILVVDEVLAVGDAEFQKRCITKMREVGESGRTVLFVSHNMATVQRLCSRALLLSSGRLVAEGPTDEIVSLYLSSTVGVGPARQWLDLRDAPGDDVARLRSVRVVNSDTETIESIDVRERVGIEIAFDILRDGGPLRPQIMLTTEQGLHAFNAWDTDARWSRRARPGRYVSTAWIPGNLLNEGTMSVSVFLSSSSPAKTLQHASELDVVAFRVVDLVEGDSAKGDWTGQWGGAVRPLLEWTVQEDVPSRL